MLTPVVDKRERRNDFARRLIFQNISLMQRRLWQAISRQTPSMKHTLFISLLQQVSEMVYGTFEIRYAENCREPFLVADA